MKNKGSKRREIALYLAFGVITTVLAFASYEGVLLIAEYGLHISMEDKGALPYIITYVLAQFLQWLVALLFTFFTNRKWVFVTADHSEGTVWKQLLRFSASRVATFFMDVIVTYILIHLLHPFIDPDTAPFVLGIQLDAELWAKIISSVLVVIAHYFLSKLFVFRKKST
jgi:putative flippase GtrA